MKHYMRLQEAPFRLIELGVKTVELRLFDEKRRCISPGDEIEFALEGNTEKTLTCSVLALHVFPSFEELYAQLPLLSCGYTEEDVDTASPKDMEIYYSIEKQRTYSVVGIEIEVV